MKRRDFLKSITAGAALLAGGGLPPAARAAEGGKKMNVLFIAADDLKPLLGCYGVPIIKTPNIDRLAAGGLLFKRAYCQQAVCAPSRNSLLTGLHGDTIGIYDLATFFRTRVPDAVTLPQLFKQHGYQAQSLGKIFHTGHGNHDDQASWSAPSWNPKKGQYALPENREGDKKRQAEAIAKGAPPAKRASLPKGVTTECADVPDNTYADGAIAEEAIRRLRQLKDQPFFLGVGFLKPHLPFVAPKKYWDLYQRADFKLPTFQTLPQGAPELAGNGSGELRAFSDIPPVGPVDEAKARELIHGYHAAVSYVDAQVGKVLDELERLGLADKTVVVLWGDHGWHLGDHGIWCKHTNFEQAAHAPLMIRVPGQPNAGAKTDALVEFVDIYPSLAELCGLKGPDNLEGTSFVPLLANPQRPWKKAAFHLFPRASKGEGQFIGYAVRTDRYRLVEWRPNNKKAQPKLELYDYQEDPEETVNLAEHPEHAATVKELRELLKRGWRAARPA